MVKVSFIIIWSCLALSNLDHLSNAFGNDCDPIYKDRCKPKDEVWKLIYTTSSPEVGYVNFDASGRSTGHVIISNASNNARLTSNAVTYDFRNNMVYWTDVTPNNEAIYRRSLDANSKVQVVVENGIHFSAGIAFDWITSNIYFSDETLSRIVVCSTTQNLCAILIRDLDKPGDIALYPRNGIMFFCDHHHGKSSIVKVGMDGSDLTSIVELTSVPDLTRLALVVDLVSQQPRLYFVDPSTNKIESIRLDGTDHKTIWNINARSTFFVDILNNLLFWSEDEHYSPNQDHQYHQQYVVIKVANFERFDPRIVWWYPKFEIGTRIKIAVFHSSHQPIYQTNPCLISNCSHICTLAPDPNTFRCFCPVGMNLGKDGKTCIEPEDLPKLLLAYGNTLEMMRFNSIGKDAFNKSKSITLDTVQTIQAIVYNPVKNSVILSDSTSKKIFEYNFEQKTLVILVDQGIEMIQALDIDPVAENLYWIDGGKKTLEVLSLRTKARAVLRHELDTPFDILVIPKLRCLLLSSHFENGTGFLHRMQLNGRESQLIRIESEILELAFYDKENDMVYWSQSKNRRIGWMSIDKGGVNALAETVFTTGGRTDAFVYNNLIYWLDYASNFIKKYNLSSNKSNLRSIRLPERVLSSFTTPKMSFIKRDENYLKELKNTNDCSNVGKFKDCSHLCLVGKEDNGECICPDGLILDIDKKTCKCPDKGQFRCDNNSNTCIDLMFKCNGFRDCPGGEDELNCKEANPCQSVGGFPKCEEETNVSNSSQKASTGNDSSRLLHTIIIIPTCVVATLVIITGLIVLILNALNRIKLECMGWSTKVGWTWDL